jgi:hypothetical protein
MRLRTPFLLTLCAFCIIAACADTQASYWCSNDVCDAYQPLPAAPDRHLIHVPAEGLCLLDQGAVPCPDLGATLRAAYPSANPQIGVCGDRKTSFARLIEVLQSLDEARLLCIDFDCDPSSVKRAPACANLPLAR